MTGNLHRTPCPPRLRGVPAGQGELRQCFRIFGVPANPYFAPVTGNLRLIGFQNQMYCGKLPPPFGPSPLKRGGARSAPLICPPNTGAIPEVGKAPNGVPLGACKQNYFANSTALVSRITLTLIWPGYSSSDSIFLAMSRARRIMLSSVTTSGLTMIRTSRPAWMA